MTVGALGDDKRAIELAQEVPTLMKKRNPLEAFILFRSKCILKLRPSSVQMKAFVYEILYLQNCLPSCTPDNLELILHGEIPTVDRLLRRKITSLFSQIAGFAFSVVISFRCATW